MVAGLDAGLINSFSYSHSSVKSGRGLCVISRDLNHSGRVCLFDGVSVTPRIPYAPLDQCRKLEFSFFFTVVGNQRGLLRFPSGRGRPSIMSLVL